MGGGDWSGVGRGTRGVHCGQEPDPATGAVVTPLVTATTYRQANAGEIGPGGWEYSRSGNPTRAALETALAGLEGITKPGCGALAFASGLAATTCVIQTLSRGDRVLCADDVYGGTNRLLNRICNPLQGIEVDIMDLTDTASACASVTEAHKIVWIESPTNPTLKCVDIKAFAEAAHAKGAILVVDNTFATPYFQHPAELGADIVLHSISKYINGHSDVIMGCLCVNRPDLFERLQFLQNAVGGVPSPFDCFMVLRGIRTLHLRMERHATNALAVAKLLEASPKVERVAYPGLPSHPQHEIAKKQMHGGYSGMVTVWLKHDGSDGAGLRASNAFLNGLKLFCLAESLGGVEGLAEVPSVMTHGSVPPDQRKELGIFDEMVRLSVGTEDEADLLADVAKALDAVP